MRKLNKTFFFLRNSFLGFWRCNRGASGPEGWWQTGHSHTETEGLWDPNTARPGVLQVHLCLSFYTLYTNIVQLNICWQSHFASPEQMNRLSLKKKNTQISSIWDVQFYCETFSNSHHLSAFQLFKSCFCSSTICDAITHFTGGTKHQMEFFVIQCLISQPVEKSQRWLSRFWFSTFNLRVTDEISGNLQQKTCKV